MAKIENTCDCNAINVEKSNLACIAINKLNNMNKMILFYKTFADETRIKIICALDAVDAMCVCDIAYSLNMTKSAISHQLKFLKDNNLVKLEKRGKEVYYSLSDNHVKDIYEIGLAHIGEKI